MYFITYNTEEFNNYIAATTFLPGYNENCIDCMHGYTYEEMHNFLPENHYETVKDKYNFHEYHTYNNTYIKPISEISKNERIFNSNLNELKAKAKRKTAKLEEHWVGPHIRCYNLKKKIIDYAFITHTEVVGSDYLYKITDPGGNFEMELPGGTLIYTNKYKWEPISKFNNKKVIVFALNAPNTKDLEPMKIIVKKDDSKVETLYGFQICCNLDTHPVLDNGIIIKHPLKKGRNF